jgi:hypothetical protein
MERTTKEKEFIFYRQIGFTYRQFCLLWKKNGTEDGMTNPSKQQACKRLERWFRTLGISPTQLPVHATTTKELDYGRRLRSFKMQCPRLKRSKRSLWRNFILNSNQCTLIWECWGATMVGNSKVQEFPSGKFSGLTGRYKNLSKFLWEEVMRAVPFKIVLLAPPYDQLPLYLWKIRRKRSSRTEQGLENLFWQSNLPTKWKTSHQIWSCDI